MATSRRAPLTLVSIAALATAVAACDSLLGLGQYSDVPPQGEPDSGSFDAFPPPYDSTMFDVFEAGAIDATDSGVALDAAPEAMPPSDAPYDAPSITALWARWAMPNPDAAIYPDAATLLPNPMAYDAGSDGGAATALDLVTGLTWWRAPFGATSASQAATACQTMGFHVPTRIQLATLIDFTQSPVTIDGATFPEVTGVPFWTASRVLDTNGAWDGMSYWTIDFQSGLVSTTVPAAQVLCVQGGP